MEFYGEESQIVMPRLLAEGRQLDFVFLDGNHRFEGVFVDLFYSGRLLTEGGAVFVDDTRLPGVRRAVDLSSRTWAGRPRMREGERSRVDRCQDWPARCDLEALCRVR